MARKPATPKVSVSGAVSINGLSLKNRRERKGWTQAEVCRRAGIPRQQTYSAWETGENTSMSLLNASRLIVHCREILEPLEDIFRDSEILVRIRRAAEIAKTAGGEVGVDPQLVAICAADLSIVRLLERMYADVTSRKKEWDNLTRTIAEDAANPELLGISEVSREINAYFEKKNNFFEELEVAAEKISEKIRAVMPTISRGIPREFLEEKDEVRAATLPAIYGLISFLKTKEIEVRLVRAAEFMSLGLSPNDTHWYSGKHSAVFLSEDLPHQDRYFRLAYQIGVLEAKEVVDSLVGRACADEGLTQGYAEQLLRIGLLNYFAGAVVMPYDECLQISRDVKFDIESISSYFGVSFEQACHRITNLRDGDRADGKKHRGAGIDSLHFYTMDASGSIIKRFGMGEIGSFRVTCTKWAAHRAILDRGRVVTQISRFQDQWKFCVAKAVVRPSRGLLPPRVRIIGFGCGIAEAKEKLIYAADLNVKQMDPIVLSSGIRKGVVDKRKTHQLNDYERRISTPVGIHCAACDHQNCESRRDNRIGQPLRVYPSRGRWGGEEYDPWR